MTIPPERTIELEIDVPASLGAVWEAFTTNAGAKTFFAPGANIEPVPGGLYEIYFMPDAEPGMRGADGMRVLAVDPLAMLSFTWNAPPSLPDVRGQRTVVTLRFAALEADVTRVRLVHSGWGRGGQWDEAFDYFTAAWGDVVLPRLQTRFTTGVITWDR